MSRLSAAKQRRTRRKVRRGRMASAAATRLSTRTRSWWPRTKSLTRYHPREGGWS